MPGWATWLLVGLAGWLLLSVAFGLFLGRVIHPSSQPREAGAPPVWAAEPVASPAPDLPYIPISAAHHRRILVVDDDATLRLLLRTTLSADEYSVEEASSAEEAGQTARERLPELVVLDVGLPGKGGLAFCHELTTRSVYESPIVILLTGGETTLEQATAAGASALLRKPFSPLELVNLIDRLLQDEIVPVHEADAAQTDQLFAYAHDLSRLWEVERAQRRILQHAYRQTMTALADALEAKHRPTRLHALRVQRLAVELTAAVDESLLDDSSLEYGFLLHDIGKIGIPDAILNKPKALDAGERHLMQRHPQLGEQILAGVTLLNGVGRAVVRSHHERWDGGGYPDRLEGVAIPIGARIFAVADAVDAMTDERPYRQRRSWDEAVAEIEAGAGGQFDPHVVDRFVAGQRRLRRIHMDVGIRAA